MASPPPPTYILYLCIDWRVADHPRYQGWTVQENSKENAGYDLVTAETWCGTPGECYLLDLGVKAMLTKADTGEPVNYWLLPRSSIYKTGHIMGNSVGVIDASYRGGLKAPVIGVREGAPGFKAGERHFQIVSPDMGWISEVRQVAELPTTQRGEGGFGSTGR
jgi:deoxyuridine 5'-triphosphate nucleotidohydrolase